MQFCIDFQSMFAAEENVFPIEAAFPLIQVYCKAETYGT